MEINKLKKWIIFIIAVVILGQVALYQYNQYRRKAFGELGYVAVVKYMNPKTGRTKIFNVVKFLDQGEGWVRFLDTDGQTVTLQDEEMKID